MRIIWLHTTKEVEESDMVRFRKLDPQEIDKLFEKPRQSNVASERARIKEEYKGYLSQLAIGEGGELILGENERKLTVRNRLNRAAEELGVRLEYKRSRGNVIRFRVVPQ